MSILVGVYICSSMLVYMCFSVCVYIHVCLCECVCMFDHCDSVCMHVTHAYNTIKFLNG